MSSTIPIASRSSLDPLADLKARVAAAADEGRAAGLCILPPVEDGTKRPHAAWKRFQEHCPTIREHSSWYPGRMGLGVVCGEASGGVEVDGGEVVGGLVAFEFDDLPTYFAFKERAEAVGLADLVERIEAGYLEHSPKPGVHLLFRCPAVGGNEKLAERPVGPQKRLALIETRERGGYLVLAPSGGKVHPSGKPYELVRGSFATITTITADERAELYGLARTFDETNAQTADAWQSTATGNDSSDGWEVRPGDEYRDRHTPGDALRADGWTELFTGDQGQTYWRRPGKDVGISAATYPSGLAYVWTTSTPLPAQKGLSSFAIYAHLHHAGDFTAAAKALHKQGYGRQAPKPGRNGKPKPDRKAEDKPKQEQELAGGRDPIEVSTEWHTVVAEAIEALRRDTDLYVRGPALVRVIDEGDAPRIIRLSDTAVGMALTRAASFYKWRADRNGEEVAVDCHPPDWLVRGVATHQYWPGLRTLESVASCPFVREDGSIADGAGYDADTRTLVRVNVQIPAIPARPTRADAAAAAARIFSVVSDFPFASPENRAVWLASLLTAVQRPAIAGPTPGFALIGNAAGVGKGLLIDAVGIIAYGSSIPTSDYPADPVEAQKCKVSIALSGKPAVHLDNLEEGRSYGSRVLDSALTSTTIDDRILGTSNTTGAIPLRPVWFLSGNNIAPGKDAHRRWLPCHLQTDLERPEERRDIAIPNLRAHVLQHRGDLLRDALTILRAHALARRPTGDWGPLGSFEVWDPIIRGAVWFATGLDCCSTLRVEAEEAPERQEKLALLEAWRELPRGGDGRGGHTANEAIELAEKHAALHAALVQLSRDGKLPTPRQIGNAIRAMKGAIIGGMRFEKGGSDARSARWRVAKVSPDSPDRSSPSESAESAESSPLPPARDLRTDYDVMAHGGGRKVTGGGGNQTQQTQQTHPALPDPDDLAEHERGPF